MFPKERRELIAQTYRTLTSAEHGAAILFGYLSLMNIAGGHVATSVLLGVASVFFESEATKHKKVLTLSSSRYILSGDHSSPQ